MIKVASHDHRFRFAHWNVRNEMFNRKGRPLSEYEGLPFGERYDLIWLFSVFTHLNPADSLAMLTLLSSTLAFWNRQKPPFFVHLRRFLFYCVSSLRVDMQ